MILYFAQMCIFTVDEICQHNMTCPHNCRLVKILTLFIRFLKLFLILRFGVSSKE